MTTVKTMLDKIGDSSLREIVDVITLDDEQDGINEKFDSIKQKYSEYDLAFLWLLAYPYENAITARKYIEASYEKFHQVLDSRFFKKLASRGKFESHMWEMVLCDILSASGKLIPKDEAGADFLLETADGTQVQIEAIAPSESEDKSLHSVKPDFSEDKFFEHGGNIEDCERPVLLRFMKAFDEKANKDYNSDLPLILAINTSKAVGTISQDEYVLRRTLFGLGYVTLSIPKSSGGSKGVNLQQNTLLSKPEKDSFLVARFRDPRYKHISGVIYTSQRSLGFTPNGYSWSNSGITYIPNPMAKNTAIVEFPFFKKLLCDEELYQEIEAEKEFESSVISD